jgi:hypothetical protein
MEKNKSDAEHRFLFKRYFKMRQKIKDQHLEQFFSENNLTGEGL